MAKNSKRYPSELNKCSFLEAEKNKIIKEIVR
jgi:hypothetical protein